MIKFKKILTYTLIVLGFICLANSASASEPSEALMRFPTPLADYPDQTGESLWKVLCTRVKQDPFNLYATIIFAFSIVHTFMNRFFNKIGNNFQERHMLRLRDLAEKGKLKGQMIPVSFRATIFHFLGEVEAIFGFWLIPLFAGMAVVGGWESMTAYVDTLAFVDKKYTEPMFVIAIMSIAASRPIIIFTGKIINIFAKLGKGTPTAWWISIMCVGPLLGSFITEPAAITICALLLSRKFFRFDPSKKLRYASLGLLLVAISVGGTLTHFAAPPVLMVAVRWNWDFWFMLAHFGGKAALGIFLSVAMYYIFFRKEFARINSRVASTCTLDDKDEYVPKAVVCVHLFFLAFTVFNLHHPAIVIFSFLFFVAYIMATQHYQYEMQLKVPILVGFFLAALVTHGTMQTWWIEPLLSRLSDAHLFVGALVLSPFNDNAAITYLGTLVPDFGETQRYLLVAGAVTSGGLTVIGNAPNPAGISILSKHFRNGVSPLYLFFGALFPTAFLAAIFYFIS